jgi:molybdenum cofactor cytidylyltransferase
MSVTALVLAAGTSSRMGQPKQVLQFEGRSLVRRAAEAAVESKARQTIVVTGAAREAVEGELTGLAVMPVHNPDYAEGLSTSLRAGLRAVRPDVEGVVVMLADQPFVSASVVDGLIDRYEEGGARIVRPRYGGQPGNPVLWDRSLFEELEEQTGDQGGRSLLQKYADEIAWLDLPDVAIQTDVDTPEAYANLTGSELSPPVGAVNRAPTDDVVPDADAVPDASLSRSGAEGEMGGEVDHADGGHPHVGGITFCARCATPLEVRPVRYDNDRPHPTCPNCDFVVWDDPKVAVLTVIPWEDGILLGLRRGRPESQKWSFPSGFVDRGEVVEEAARRETLEETGLDVELTGLIGVYSERGKPVIVIAYAAEVRGGALSPDDDLVELRGFPLDALPALAFEHDAQIIRDWQAFRARTTVRQP